MNEKTLNITQDVGYVNLTSRDIEEDSSLLIKDLTNEELQELGKTPEEYEDDGLPESYTTLATKSMSIVFRPIGEVLS